MYDASYTTYCSYVPSRVKVPWMRRQVRKTPAAKTRHAERAPGAEAEQILALVRALRRDLLRNPSEDAEGFGLTGPQVSVMACLVGRGPTTLTEVSRALGMNHSTASGIVDRLQSRGLVRRTRDSADLRRTRITVTERVARYVGELREGPSGRLARALGGASAAERRAIKKGLSLLCGLLRSKPEAASSGTSSPLT